MKQVLLFVILAIAICSTSANVCASSPDGEHHPHESDCGLFIVCHESKETVKECATGLHFSPTELYCLPPDEAGCEHNTGPTKPTRPTKPTTPTKPTKPTDAPATSCKNQPLGKRVHYPNDCTKFIVCIGGGVTMDCPPPLHFNAALEVCDWPERANCPWK